MMYQQVGDAFAVFASAGGADKHPAWFHNIVANPQVSAEIGSETRQFHARVTEGAEREQIWEKQKQDHPAFADYEASTDRVIPVVVLEAS